MNKPSKTTIVKLLAAAALFCAPSLKAQYLEYVTIDTSTLSSLTGDGSNAPFYLDFQLNQGSDPISSTVTISNISLGGGAAVGGPSVFEGATGSITGSITLTSSTINPNVELFQEFSPGSTISFIANLPQQFTGSTPTQFAVTIYDSTASGIIPSSAPDGQSLNAVSISASYTPGSLGAFTATEGDTVVSTTAVPEPSTWASLAIGGVLVGVVALRRKKLAKVA